MKSKFLISTTNNIEGTPIKRYIGALCSNIVIGTNVFSDFAASFTDFFGGRSDSYKRKKRTNLTLCYRHDGHKNGKITKTLLTRFRFY